jgi:hypothetical protein
MAIDRSESVDIDDYCQHVASPKVLSEDDETGWDVDLEPTPVDARNVRRRKSNPKRAQSQLFKGLSNVFQSPELVADCKQD